MKKQIFALLVLSFLIFAGLGSLSSAKETTPIEVVYDVHNDQNATVTWYDENFNPIHYEFSENDNLTVNIHNLNDSDTLLDISIGNLSLTDVPDTIAESNLILSYWKLGQNLGFVANVSNWDIIEEAVANLTINVHTFEMIQTSEFFGISLSIVEIVFNDGVQSTILKYEKETGLLMAVDTGAFGFSLSFSVSEINGSTTFFGEPQTTNPPTTTAVPISFLAIATGIVIRNRKKF